MTALDIIVLFLIAAGAVFGFLRGFVQEALSLLAWAVVIAAVRFLHAPATLLLVEPVGTDAGAAVLAFLLIAIISWGLARWAASAVGARSRKSVLGPVDRVLGFGFGAIKGLIGATFLFLLIVMVLETMFGSADKPVWLTESRTYPLLNASGDAISGFVAARRERAGEDAEADDADAAGDENGGGEDAGGAKAARRPER